MQPLEEYVTWLETVLKAVVMRNLGEVVLTAHELAQAETVEYIQLKSTAGLVIRVLSEKGD